ncbi:MAG: DUF523 domain-containing protein [Patescibacteria group bacterium]
MKEKTVKICSACLLGVNCRFDGATKVNKKVLALAKKEILIPVCPEQLAGLSTPRERAEKVKNKVLTESGEDVSIKFKLGAQEVLKIAKTLKVKEAILKQNSPSCGFGSVFDGSFSGKKIKGNGVTADLLSKNKIKVITEQDLK